MNGRPPRRAGYLLFFREYVAGRRGEVLDAALTVFDDKGYEAGTMREIAQVVGVSEPALYRHFASKEALFAEVVDLASERFVQEARDLMATLDPRDVRGSLTAILEDRRRALRRYSPVARTLIAVAVHRDEFRRLFASKMVQPLREDLLATVPLVDAALGLDRTREETERRVHAYMSMFVGYYMSSLLFAEDEPAAIVDGIVAVMGWE